MTRAPFVLFCGDLHAGSTAAVCPKGVTWTRQQAELADNWQAMTKRALAESKKAPLLLMLGGDLVDGARHHGTWETWGTPGEQRDGAVALLQPLANAAAGIYALLGTEAHAGPKSEDDKTVARELGARTAHYILTLTIAGRRLLWSHHGVRVSRDPQNDSNMLFTMARRLNEHALRAAIAPPDLAVFHDAHFSPAPVTAQGITVAVCGCWQTNTSYGYKIAPERTPDLGVLAWWPETNKLERWLYPLKAAGYEEVKISR